MDYLSRDSFFSGVVEGMIAYDRIIKMLVVHDGELMVEEKGIYSIEKFLVSRRLMYWQVYLHKTVLCAEQMLQRIIRRAKYLKAPTQTVLNKFINQPIETVTLQEFCEIDDNDVLTAIKEWSKHPDKVLSFLCKGILNRDLLKVKYYPSAVATELLAEKVAQAATKLELTTEEAGWLVFAIASVVYFFSVETTGSLWDCGEFISGAYKLQVVHPPGAPIFLLVGRMFAWVGSMVSNDPAVIAFSVNLLSGLCTAAAAMFTAWATGLLAKLALVGREEDTTDGQNIAIAGAGLVGMAAGPGRLENIVPFAFPFSHLAR